LKTTDLRGRHDLGEIIGLAWRLYRGNFVPMFLIALTTVPLQMLAAALQDNIASSTGAATASAMAQIAGTLVTIVAAGALIHASNDAATGVRPDFARSIDASIERFDRLLTTGLLAALLSILSLLALPYFVIRWTFNSWAVMLEDKRNWSALDASSSIVKGQWWRTFGILMTIVLIIAGPSIIAGAAQALPPLPAATITSGVGALVIPFAVAAQTLLYYDLRARREVAAPPAVPEPESEPDTDSTDQ